MLRFDSMLMIGSSGSNVGKTELACRLLQRFSRTREIVDGSTLSARRPGLLRVLGNGGRVSYHGGNQL